MEDVFKHLQNIWKKLKEGLAHAGAQKNNFTTLESLTGSHGKHLQKLYKAIYKKNRKRLWSPITPHRRPTRRTPNHT